MDIGMVPGHTWAPEWCPDTHGHQNGAWARMSTGMVPGCTWSPYRFPGTHGNRKIAHEHLETGRMPGTLVNRKGARARMGT